MPEGQQDLENQCRDHFVRIGFEELKERLGRLEAGFDHRDPKLDEVRQLVIRLAAERMARWPKWE